MISIWIKGEMQDALDAASQRNIPVSNLRLSADGRCFRADVEKQYQIGIIQWYGEPSTIVEGQGYPNGTLLFYTM